MNKLTKNWILDILLFAAFILTFLLDLTGLSLHQWLGIFCAVLIAVHIAQHIRWIFEVTRKLFRNPSKRTIINYLMDATILLGFIDIIVSGLIISTWLELPLTNYRVVADIHVALSIFTLIMIIFKIGLHWKWIVQRLSKKANPSLVLQGDVVPVSQSVNRRQFLTLMGAVGLASYVAMKSALNQYSLPSPESVDLGANNEFTETQISTSQVSQSNQVLNTTLTSPPSPFLSTPTPPEVQIPTAKPCIVRCDNHCSYPGRCRRYVDTNRNNLCDNGECL